MAEISTSIPIVIIAGGQSQRLQLDGKRKWQLPFGDQPLIDFIITRLQQQTNTIVINAPSADAHLLSNTGLPVIFDDQNLPASNDKEGAFKGPLAGLLSALHWAKQHQRDWVATVACDTPFFPETLITDLLHNLETSGLLAATACCDSQNHAVFGLWSSRLHEPLLNALTQDKIRALRQWTRRCGATSVNFGAIEQGTAIIDPFFNINTADDYQQALEYLGQNIVKL